MNNSEIPTRSWTSWFEIAVTDMQRAKKFYDTVFQIDIQVVEFGGFTMGIFPHNNTGCALCIGEWYKPSTDGTLVYMNANPDLQESQDRIEKAGGKIIMPKKQISPEHGYMCIFIDSEGNRMALHSDN